MKQITIYDLLPLLKKGWVAMDKDGSWGWYRTRPFFVGSDFWVNNGDRDSSMFFCFRIKRFKGSWRDSLIKVEHKEEDTFLMVDKPTGPEWYKNGKRIKYRRKNEIYL